MKRRPIDMETESLQDILSTLSIRQTSSSDGTSQYSIPVFVDEAGDTRTAYFEPALKLWKLSNFSNTSDGSNNGQIVEATAKQLSKAQQKLSSYLESYRWADHIPPSPHIDFFLNTNWAATSLGPYQTWPRCLRLYTHMLMSDSRSAVIYWGPERLGIYNEKFLPLIGDLHPKLMGNSFHIIMPDLWAMFSSIFHGLEAGQGGQATAAPIEVPLARHGYIEETWWTGGAISLKDDNGGYGGAYFPWIEVTRTVVGDRRAALVNQLTQPPSVNISSIWNFVHEVLGNFEHDIPMAMIYEVDHSDGNTSHARLRHTIGLGSQYAAAQELVVCSRPDVESPLNSHLRRASESSLEYIIVDLADPATDPALYTGVEWRGHGEASRHLVVIPLRAKNSIKGYTIIGLNPRKAFDADHAKFVSEIARQLRELMTKITTEDESRMREEQLMKELTESEKRIRRIMALAPVGIYDLSPTGELLFANIYFWDIMGVPEDKRTPSSFDWHAYIHTEEHSTADQDMEKGVGERSDISQSLRLRKSWKPPVPEGEPPLPDEPYWILYSASPDLNEDGTVRSLTGCCTNISHLKWAEQLQIRNAAAAQNEKKRQEEFIDITSHEMRNPLSAITQCADAVAMSLRDAEQSSDAQALLEIIRSNVDAAESILFCAAHQRRIIDDVLTLGKLESELLTIAPTIFRVQALIEEALQIFRAEFTSNDIEI